MSKKSGGVGSGGSGGGGKGRPAVFDAIEDEDLSAVKGLLPAALELRNKDGFTPLLYASYVGCLEIVRCLLDAGADVRAKCKDNDTCLHYASAQGHAEVVALLASNKRTLLDAADNDGETPADVAASGKMKKLIEKLIEKRAEEEEEEGEEEEGEEEEGGEEESK